MRRAPARPARACFVRNWCLVSHATFEAPLRTSHLTVFTLRRTDEVAFIAGCSNFTRKNARFRAPASSPTHSPCNIMQQFQCNLQPEIQEPHRTTHTDTATRCKTHRRNNSRTKRPQPQPPHRRGSFHRRLQPLYTEKDKVWCSGFLPTHSPCNIMQPLQCVSQHPVANLHLSTHVATSNDKSEAAVPMQSATRDSRTA